MGDSSGDEDKKCRICGLADIKNVNIFTCNKPMLNKILTVYPIIIFKNDPLPKNICKKCICHVNSMFSETQRVLKTQNKWISNVRNTDPNHSYIKILDIIENSNKKIREIIKTTHGEEINIQTPKRFLLQCEDETTIKQEPTTKPQEISLEPHRQMYTKSPKTTAKLSKIKSKFKYNGCNMQEVESKKQQKQSAATKRKSQISYVQKCKKDEIVDEDDVALSQLASKQPKNSATVSKNTFKCQYCLEKFESTTLLVKHQLVHLRLKLPKILQKKYLNKDLRKGRLITINNRKCLRCLNCWQVFSDNQSILNHWTEGECDYYCSICGKNFAHAPKMLREHVTAAHEISYRSLKIQRMRTFGKKLWFKHSSSPSKLISGPSIIPKTEISTPTSPLSSPLVIKKTSDLTINSDGTVSCNICMKVFRNFKARNSHMRTHKKSNGYTHIVLPSVVKSTSSNAKRLDTPKTSLDTDKNLVLEKMNDTKSFLPIQPSLKSATSSSVVRGVRTKFVLKRNKLIPASNDLQKPTVSNVSVPEKRSNAPETCIKHEPMNIVDIKQEPIITSNEEIPSEPLASAESSNQFPKRQLKHKELHYANHFIYCKLCGKSFIDRNDYCLHSLKTHNI